MKHYDKLTNNRKSFINQLYTLVFNQFEAQNKIAEAKNEKEIMEELENNPDYIQRIFIDAPWGMGKSYFGKSLEELIEDRNNSLSNKKKIKPIKINAWEVDYYSDPMKSLMAEILEVVSDQEKEKIQEYFESLVKIGAKKILKTIAKILMSLVIGKDNCKNIFEVCNSIVSELPENEDFFKDYKEYRETLLKFKETLSKSEEYKVVIIDELDRCRPTYAIELLETVKHIFGVKNIIFIFLVNKSQLKSTVSTMYLQEDECGEYFEKFFDIQFRLPDIDYEDFIKLEYNKYSKIESYCIENNTSKEIEIFLESLFIDVFEANYLNYGEAPSARKFIKSFKKYKLLLFSLSEEEKSCYLLMIFLIIYFLEKEFLWEKENRKLVYLKTFFVLRNKKNITRTYSLDDFYEEFEHKNKYAINNNIYKIFYEIIYLETGIEMDSPNFFRNLCSSLVLKGNFLDSESISIEVEDIQFHIENLKCNIIDSRYGGYLIQVKDNYFSSVQKNNYSLGNGYYDINLLYEWCKEKYDFVIKSDLRR